MTRNVRCLAGIVVLTFASGATADDCALCGDAPCAEHEQEEKAALAEFVQDSANELADARLSALERMAAVCRKRLNCRVMETARLVGRLLGDRDHKVRMRAAEIMRETQNPHKAAELAAFYTRQLRPTLEKPPKAGAPRDAWDQDLEFYKALARLLGESGVLEASPGIADLLKATSMDLLEIAANNCSRVRTHEVATAVLEAMGRARGPDAKAGKVSLALYLAWKTITRAEIRAPKGGNPEDFDRFLASCRAWLKEHPGDPEGWLK